MPNPEPTGRKIRVLIVDDIAETRDNVRKLLFFEDDIEIVGNAASGQEGIDLAGKLQPDIVLMDINMPGMDGIAASAQIAEALPQAQVVMMSVQGEADYLRRSMLAGAREFLVKPFSGEELATSIRRVHQLSSTRRVASLPPVTAPTFDQAPAKRGKIISVFGTKGGCGASTLVVNIAIALREETNERVAIVDANFEFGDIGVLLNLPSNRTIADLASARGELDEDIVAGIMATHSSGVKVLLAPARPEMAELISPDHLKRVFEHLSRMFDYIVVDVCRTFRDPTVAILDISDEILLVATNDIPAIKNAKLFFELADQLAYPPEKILLILDKDDGRSGIGAKDIEASIKHPVRGIIPKDDRTNQLAINRGVPFVSLDRRLPLTQSVVALARGLLQPRAIAATQEQSAPAKSGWFRLK